MCALFGFPLPPTPYPHPAYRWRDRWCFRFCGASLAERAFSAPFLAPPFPRPLSPILRIGGGIAGVGWGNIVQLICNCPASILGCNDF